MGKPIGDVAADPLGTTNNPLPSDFTGGMGGLINPLSKMQRRENMTDHTLEALNPKTGKYEQVYEAYVQDATPNEGSPSGMQLRDFLASDPTRPGGATKVSTTHENNGLFFWNTVLPAAVTALTAYAGGGLAAGAGGGAAAAGGSAAGGEGGAAAAGGGEAGAAGSAGAGGAVETMPVQDIAVDPSLSAPYGSASAGTGIWSGNVFGPGGVIPFGAQGDVTAPSAASGGAAPAAATPKTAPVTPSGSTPSAGAGGAQTSVTGAQGTDQVGSILKGMKDNANLIGLGLSGAGLLAAGQQKSIPNEQQLNDLAATGSQAAKDLIASYRSGHVSAAQQAQLDQLTQGTKNQINQYFASIGQSDSTAHMQALAQVDQQALGMKQQMLDNMLSQGLTAIGVASGPLNNVANFQISRDKNLTDAFGNFANAVGKAFGRQAGTTVSPTPAITGQTPSSGVAIRSGGTGIQSPAAQ